LKSGGLFEELRQLLHRRLDPNDWQRVCKLQEGAFYTPLTTHGHERIGTRERLIAVRSRFPDRLHIEGARLTGARRLVGHQGRELLLGGFDRVLDCVGSGESLEQATTITRPRGRVVLVGMPGALKADLAAAWLRELELRAAYGYEHDFPAALAFAKELRPSRLIDRGWPLRAFKKALETAPQAARNGRAKTVFEVAA